MRVGISGAERDACVAIAGATEILGVCQQERVLRARNIGVISGGFPHEALAALAPFAPATGAEPASYVTAESTLLRLLPQGSELTDHHGAHAALAASELPQGRDAIVCVCDRQPGAEVSFWERRNGGLRRVASWSGAGFATALARAAAALGFSHNQLFKFEALARTGTRGPSACIESLIRLGDDGLEIDAGFEAELEREATGRRTSGGLASLAFDIQAHLETLLIDGLRRAGATDHNHVALSGGLFYNTGFCTAVARAELFETVAVPVDPGNGGLAVGALIERYGIPGPVPPFLGPGTDLHETKAVLDNCKLSYGYAKDDTVIQETVRALGDGQLIGWMQGRMEWGRRALGNRSILANPFAPFVLENLNRFLKHREPYVSYGLVVCEEDVDRYFSGPPASPFMQFEYEVREPETLRHFLPRHAQRVRVQTVREGWMRRLLKAFEASGRPAMLANTSFNGFREPIVCTPRDAVRVFFGTGLDMLVIGNFILRK